MPNTTKRFISWRRPPELLKRASAVDLVNPFTGRYYQPAGQTLITAELPLITQPLPHPGHAVACQNLFDILYPSQSTSHS